MKLTKETIWHFICKHCSGWFSIASSDEYNPKDKKLYCPWCGKKEKVELRR